MHKVVEYIMFAAGLFVILILSLGMSEKHILSLILISVVGIFWHLLSKDSRDK